MKDRDGNIYDCICPEEHDRAEGDYTIPLYNHPVKELTDEPMRKYVEDFAARCGWVKGGEGAFEYIERKSYAQGFEDGSVKKPVFTEDEIWLL